MYCMVHLGIPLSLAASGVTGSGSFTLPSSRAASFDVAAAIPSHTSIKGACVGG